MSTTEQPSFTCPVCGMTSYHPEDIRQGYCGKCHGWTGGEWPTNEDVRIAAEMHGEAEAGRFGWITDEKDYRVKKRLHDDLAVASKKYTDAGKPNETTPEGFRKMHEAVREIVEALGPMLAEYEREHPDTVRDDSVNQGIYGES
jgi:hypothetical protein